jgi:hypothetical protein
LDTPQDFQPINIPDGNIFPVSPKWRHGSRPQIKSPNGEALLWTKVIKRLIKYEPDARELLDQITPADSSDNVDDLFRDEDEGEGDEEDDREGEGEGA